MKEKKLNLEKLKVSSFVTKKEAKDINGVKGGGSNNPCSICCIVDLPSFCCQGITNIYRC